ncbi:AAA family ATPase [Sorangium sp. So ce1078]|uniref:AAA family ATPase n=1 Tax=Sorangium sp. So ce1078 TaxID=3133329 RepID=UPI003F5D5FA7
MRFRVENLGPLREAEVDLSKDLLVLTGPNNTGKTYFAWSVYGLLRTPPKGLEGIGKKLLAAAGAEVDLTPLWGECLSDVARAFQGNLRSCFAAPAHSFDRTKIDLRIDDPAWLSERLFPLEMARHLGAISSSPTVRLNDDLSISLDVRPPAQAAIRVLGRAADGSHSNSIGWDSVPAELQEFLPTVAGRLLGSVMTWFTTGCDVFPAERIAVNIFAKELALKRMELVSEVLDESDERGAADAFGAVLRRAGRYPWPIQHSLLVANDMANLAKKESKHADLAREIESAILGGVVRVSEHGELTFAPHQASDDHLAIHLTASVVKSLASLVFYFRHLARGRELLIIDEPELNLHPDNQRKIARILAKAVNRGFKVMMSTHSDYIIRELNHLIMLGTPSEKTHRLAEELGYDPACLIRPERIGVYLFQDGTARPIEVNETGFDVKTIEDEIVKVNSVTQRLFAELFE